MGYLKSSLSGEEKLLHTFSIHWFGYLWYGFWSLGLIGIPGLLRLIGTEMGVTSRRLILKTGIIARRTNEIQIIKIETVEIGQGILGRIFSYGTVRATGTGTSDVSLVLVSDPLRVKKQIESVLE